METKEFFDMVNGLLRDCKNILGEKNVEYARGGDKLHNFKIAGALEQTTPERALRGMMTKHVISIYDFINDLENGIDHPLEKWDEKINDNINYLLLLRGLLVERYSDGDNG